MKRILLLFAAVLVFIPSFAQGGPKKSKEEMRKEIFDYKLKFLAQEMELKDNQVKKFTELYTKMSQEKARIFHTARELDRKVRSDANATEADFNRASKAMAEAKEKEVEIDNRYEKQFKTFLTSKQIFKMKEAEQQFREKMKQMRNETKGKHHNKGAKK